MIQYLVNGLAMGSLYALLGLGLALTFRGTAVLNFAQGELAMLMAFVCYILIERQNASLVVAFILTGVCAAVVGLAIYNLVAYPNRNQDHETLAMVTVGLKLAISGLAALAFGVDAHVFPRLFEVDRYEWMGLSIGASQAWTILLGFAAMGLIAAFLKYTTLGLAMRAAAENVNMAQLLGVDLRLVGSLTWIAAVLLSAVTGILFASTVLLSPYMMGLVILKAFAALVLGGMTSIPGVILGGLIVGLSEALVAYAFDPIFQESVALVLIIVILMVKPQGLLGGKSAWRA